MIKCDRCKNVFEGYIERSIHRCYYVDEWKKFQKSYSAETVGNQYQFFNFFTQQNESYDYLSVAEIILHKHKIIFLIDHINRKRVGKMCPVPFKEKLKVGLKNLPSKITMQNFDKGMKIFDKGMKNFSDSIDAVTNQLGSGQSVRNGKRNQKNLKALVGSKKKKDNVKDNEIWGKQTRSKKPKFKLWADEEKPRKQRRRRRSQSDDRTNGERNVDKIWGKRK